MIVVPFTAILSILLLIKLNNQGILYLAKMEKLDKFKDAEQLIAVRKYLENAIVFDSLTREIWAESEIQHYLRTYASKVKKNIIPYDEISSLCHSAYDAIEQITSLNSKVSFEGVKSVKIVGEPKWFYEDERKKSDFDFSCIDYMSTRKQNKGKKDILKELNDSIKQVSRDKHDYFRKNRIFDISTID